MYPHHSVRRSNRLMLRARNRTMSSAASLSKKDVRVLRRARRILESRGLPADAVFQFGGDRSVSRDQQVLGRLAAEGVEVHDMGEFGEELVAEAKAEAEELEEVRLDEEEEARWGECQADWCARCVRYLHVDPFHVCQFERDDKCERCIAQGRGGGSACVAVCIMNSSLDVAQMLISFMIVTRPPPTTTKRCAVSCSAHIRRAIMARKSRGVESLSALVRLTSACAVSPFVPAAVVFLLLRWLFPLPAPRPP